MNKKYLIMSIILLILSISYTLLIKNIDVAPIGPNNSEVGFSHINETVHDITKVNMIWYYITNYLGILPFFLVAYYGLLGLKQLLVEKNLKKVDIKLIILGIFYFTFAIIYLLFEKIVINCRPVLFDGKLEASYPSSHTMLAIFVCGSSLLMSKYFIKNEKARKIVNIITAIVMVAIIVGRTISGVHWATDILGGMIIGLFLLYSLKAAISYIEK